MLRDDKARPSTALTALGVASLTILAACFVVLDSLHWTIKAWRAAPWLDQWETVGEYIRIKSGGSWWTELVRPHNEHRLVIPRLFFFADYEWFGGANRLLVPLCVAIQAYHAALLAWVGRPANPASLSIRVSYVIAVCVVAGLLFSLAQFENFFWGFQIAFVGVLAVTTTCYALLARCLTCRRDGEAWRTCFTGAILGLVGAIFIMANGVLAAAVGVLLLIALRADWRLIVIAALIVSCAVLAFFADYGAMNGGGGGLDTLWRKPAQVAQYVAAFIGGIANGAALGVAPNQSPVGACVALGVVGIVLSVAAALRVAFQQDQDARRIVLVGLMVFVGASAIVTAAGRLDHFGVQQALSSRYATVSGVFWAAILLYWLSVAWDARRRTLWISVATGANLLLLLLILIGQPAVRPTVQAWILRVSWGEDALASNVPDLEAVSGISFNPTLALEQAQFLQRHGLGLYGRRETTWLGHRLDQRLAIKPARCRGAIDLAGRAPELVATEGRVEGWGVTLEEQGRIGRVIITDGDLVVRGFGSAGRPRPDLVQAGLSKGAAYAGWRGFAHMSNGETLRAFAMLSQRDACELGSLVVAGLEPGSSFDRIQRDSVGDVIPAEARGEGVFITDGFPTEIGPAPGPAYASWAANDANTGAIFFGPFVATSDTIAFALVTGPQTRGLVVRLEDAQTGEVLRQVRPAPRLSWSWVGMRVPRGRPLRLSARDAGRGFGEWVGITTPFETRSAQRSR